MLIDNNKIYRNLQEQVLQNQDQIAILKKEKYISDLGIKIIDPNPLPNAASLPTNYTGSYGDAYLVGTAAPYNLYIWTRSNQPSVPGYWFDFGPLNAPSTVQGPPGETGATGPQGTRGSLWYSQTGAPTNTSGVNSNDQALNTSNGDVYQFVNGQWQFVGNIRGPQGIQGQPGKDGLMGPQGQIGPQGPKGDQGQFIEIVGVLPSSSQLPDPNTVPRYTAYIIPLDSIEHIWLIVGEGTTENPLVWRDAGSFGGGTKIVIGSATFDSVDMGKVYNGPISYTIGNNTTVTSDTNKITVGAMEATGENLDHKTINYTATIELPIANSDDIEVTITGKKAALTITDDFKQSIISDVENAGPVEVQITAPSTATNGQLSEEQLATLQANAGAYLKFNDEIYRLQDVQHNSGYLVYSHIGFDNINTQYIVKCITVTISTRGWVLTQQIISDAPTGDWMAYETVNTLPATGDYNKIYLVMEVK